VTIIDLLSAYGAAVVPPCQYSFPVAFTEEFLALGDIITSVEMRSIWGREIFRDLAASRGPRIHLTISGFQALKSKIRLIPLAGCLREYLATASAPL
jgi:hypothetical protein